VGKKKGAFSKNINMPALKKTAKSFNATINDIVMAVTSVGIK